MDKIAVKSRDMGALAGYVNHLRANPRLVYLFIELTTCCNLYCMHCGSSCGDGVRMHMDTQLLFDALDAVAEDFAEQKPMICLTGGEPMLHPDFRAIVSRIDALGFPWGMTTNGTLIDWEMARFLKAHRLGSVTISIDGTANTHDAFRRVSGAWEKAVHGVEALHKAGIEVQITSVIHRGNFSELDDLYALMCSMRVCSWRVINVEPIGRALENSSMLLTEEQFDSLIDFIRRKRFAADTPMDVRFGCSHYLSFEAEREVRDNYFLCGSGIIVGSILVNGDIYSCLDIERRPELVQGNVKNMRFSEAWKNGFRAFREDRSEKCEECRSCSERAFCCGDSGHTWDYENNKPMFCIKRKGYYHGI